MKKVRCERARTTERASRSRGTIDSSEDVVGRGLNEFVEVLQCW
jgi:hypothetical protein